MPHRSEPTRPADVARLELTRLRLEDITLDLFFQKVTETVARLIQVERVGVWLFVEDRQALRCMDLFEQSRQAHSAGITLRITDFPEYFAALERRKTVPAEAATIDPRTSELNEPYLQPLDISSMLDAGIFVDGELVGVVCQEHIGVPREWSTEERDFASSMADQLAMKIRSAEMFEARIAINSHAEQVAESKRLDSLAVMAAGAAHDLNNILAVVGYWTARLQQSIDNASEALQQISEATARGRALSSELMAFAKPGKNSVRVICPAELITSHQLVLQASVGDSHVIKLEIEQPPGMAFIATQQLERIMLNLALNARDAMPDGGHIVVRVRKVREKFNDGKPGAFVLLEVIDTGTGISPRDLPRIFDPFFTTKPRGLGTGLGLAVVHQIVGQVGGFLRVQSEQGQGSNFQVYLPQVTGN